MENTLFDRTFRDSEGEIVIAQPPNLPLIVGIVASLLKLIVTTGQINLALDLVAFGSLFTWAWKELFQGVNYFHRALGLNTVYLRSNKWYTRYDVQKSKSSIVLYKKLLLESPKLKSIDIFKAIEIAIPSTEIEAAILKAKAFIETASWATITTGSMSNHSNELMVKRLNARRTKESD